MIPKDLPKAELHCHLEGTIPPSLAKKIAKRNNVELSSNLFEDENTYAWDDFASFWMLMMMLVYAYVPQKIIET